MIFDYAVVNGRLLPFDQAQISLFHQAVFSSFGVYEAVKVDRGRPFYLAEHLSRLFNSADAIELALGVDAPTLLEWFKLLAAPDPQATWTLRLMALGSVRLEDEPIVTMWPEPLRTYPQQLYRAGARAILYAGQRSLPTCKSLNTLVNYLARREAVRRGALEGLLYHHGHLTEGARSNLFAVKEGQLVTPPADQVLSGITRDVIFCQMEETDYPVGEAPITTDLSLYDELFISSTSMHVMPITVVDGQPIGPGRVGPVTQLAMSRFEAHYRQVMADMTTKELS